MLIYSDETPEHPPTSIEPLDRVVQAKTVELAFLRGNHYNSVVPLDDNSVEPGSAVHPAFSSSNMSECIYCGARVDDVDLHVALDHADLFG